MSYYHYTNGCHLAKIVNEGLIRTSKMFLDEKVKPAAWLTKSPEWDIACNVGIVKNTKKLAVLQDYFFDEVEIETVDTDYMKKKIGMCRILINKRLPVISWAKFRYVSGIKWTSYYIIDENSKYTSPVEKWICTFSGIPRKYWEGIEMYVDDQWVRWDEVTPIEEFVDVCLSRNRKQEEEEEEEMINGLPKVDTQGKLEFIDLNHEEMKVILSKHVRMISEKTEELVAKRDYKQLNEYVMSDEYRKFDKIADMELEDEEGNGLILYLSDGFNNKQVIVYTVNVKTLEVDLLLVEEDYKKAERFFYGFKYSDKYFEIEDNLDEGESIMSEIKNGVWVNYVLKIENDEFVSTIELNEYRLNKGLKPIDFNPMEDMYKSA
ncbi:MAG: hypothetical protein H6540_04635 [Bacteroidales bacterium]|nr:hypothetical protein [Bacteroidales bacterium]